MNQRFGLFATALLTLGAGCAPNPSEDPADWTVKLDECKGASSQEQVDQNIAIARQLVESYHELIACGQAMNNYSYMLSEFFANLSQGQPSYPQGFMYTGSGFYIVGGGVMTVQSSLAKDTTFGKAGEDVPFDLFDGASYYESASFKASLSLDTSWSTEEGFQGHYTGSIEMTLEKSNPEALELFGIDATQTTTTQQQEELAAKIADNVNFTVKIDQSANGVGLKTAIGPKRIDELYSGQTLLIPQIAPVLANPEIDQQIGVVQWDIAFLPIVAPSLDGRVAFGATGGHFPYYITFVYDSPGAPDVVLSCQPLP
ncbi:MAG TPA: hypothetical protein VE093_14900 [Polyangiaceae bacterium]|jgi:hypothetical protein|nr:hypothetical protein [Polyangiaceae bacterium]